jgi:hypothetical protein
MFTGTDLNPSPVQGSGSAVELPCIQMWCLGGAGLLDAVSGVLCIHARLWVD